MAKIDRYPAKWETQLDCGHMLPAGQTVVITKTYTCEKHAQEPIHTTLTSIKESLENGAKMLKLLEWDLRHKERS